MQNIEDIYNYSTMNTLIIPESLYQMKGVQKILSNHQNAILYKNFQEDLVNTEFYTNRHCIVFSCSGIETITSFDFEDIKIYENEMLFLPKDMYLISDFKKAEISLSAYMFFFDDDVIEKFLYTKRTSKHIKKQSIKFFKMNVNSSILAYIDSLKNICKNAGNSKEFLELKLLELLYLINENDKDNKLISFLSTKNIEKHRRNIVSLMKRYYLHNFTVKDFALLSGRSIATFHRDFKKEHNISPKQYLIDKRLEHAHSLLQKEELSVTEVASEIGYKNISHFIKAYKNRYGFTPKQFNKS